ncbi:hypothetical protein LLS1_18190 [Leifsonia sp. LS1]|uniref:hypothetical protein n=1 Tax=Leifsonia sp. LS1 TaxID=2828483 RepID=UPI001CFCEC67|nr:hypothetical protein [Leifsonia sp. LS1]GIT80150.1 hypothetical protein LLS1_18190 [Leifsonia sp. LS1]
MKSGEFWGYRVRQADPLLAVEVLRIGDKRPARVLVRFVDESMEGRREWVPPVRLKVLWADRGPFIEKEERWAAIRELGVKNDSATDFAADVVFRLTVPRRVAEYEMSGYARVYDIERLAQAAEIEIEAVNSHPASFAIDESTWALPWPTVEQIVKLIALKHANRILQYVEAEERDFETKATHGYDYRSVVTGEIAFMDPEDVASSEMEEYQRPMWNLLRQWCGAETVDIRDELNALRVEVRRIGEVAERAIGVLRIHGFIREAERLRHDLGVRVEKPGER